MALPPDEIRTPQQLARALAAAAHCVRARILALYPAEPETGVLHQLLRTCRVTLAQDIPLEHLADIYAQALSYGLFAARAARVARPGSSGEESISFFLSHASPLLKSLFAPLFPAGSLPPPLTPTDLGLGAIGRLLEDTDVAAILADYGRVKQRSDPVLHFYESFVATYDPAQKARRGIFYTPDEVVAYMVQGVDFLLRAELGWEGLADETFAPAPPNAPAGALRVPRVQILDPATGTGTFLAAIIEFVKREFTRAHAALPPEGLRAKWADHVDRVLLPQLHGFEVLLAPYAVAHLKIGLALAHTGYAPPAGPRAGIYLADALEAPTGGASSLDGYLRPPGGAPDKIRAARVKGSLPITVVLGNPPYAGESQNKGEWIHALLRGGGTPAPLAENYFAVDGAPLGEKNPKWLNDDYVKFFRLGQWILARAGQGILALVTNHMYLYNPTFRGMRRSLLGSFGKIYVLNLHGNRKMKEQCPDGSKDENVFDIKNTGACIAFFVKGGKAPASNPSPAPLPSPPSAPALAQVFYCDLWGTRAAKAAFLLARDFPSTQWAEITPRPPFYLFVPFQTAHAEQYHTFWRLQDIFRASVVGIVTARDSLAIQPTAAQLWAVVQDFSALGEEEARAKYRLGADVRDWKVAWAQQDLRDSGPSPALVAPILYRPFDVRYTYYTGRSRGFLCMPRALMAALRADNLSLCVGRAGQVVGASADWNLVFCARQLVDFNLFYRGGNANFPLYLHEGGAKTSNVSPTVLDLLAKTYGRPVPAEGVFHYLYAVLHAPAYRRQFAEFLKLDFPRLPFPADPVAFEGLARLGARLVTLHTLADVPPAPPLACLAGDGDAIVREVRFDPAANRIYVNAGQYFQNIPSPDLWATRIGGYPVLQKWLEDRHGRVLNPADQATYGQVLAAVAATADLQRQVDALFPAVLSAAISCPDRPLGGID